MLRSSLNSQLFLSKYISFSLMGVSLEFLWNISIKRQLTFPGKGSEREIRKNHSVFYDLTSKSMHCCFYLQDQIQFRIPVQI